MGEVGDEKAQIEREGTEGLRSRKKKRDDETLTGSVEMSCLD